MRISEKTQPATVATYVQRVNLAIDHIVGHLHEPLRLRDLARVAMLSPFHFHRVFQALVGSTPTDFVKRLRLEKALGLMSRTRPISLTTIAQECGFSSSSDFSRCFKRRFGVPPRSFDIKAWREAHGDQLNAIVEQAARPAHIDRLPPRHNPDAFRVKIRDLPSRTVAYIRVDKPYQGNGVIKAVQTLVAWAERNGFADGQWLGYQWDDPEITSLEDCRYYVAVEGGGAVHPQGRGGPAPVSAHGRGASRNPRGARSRASRLAMALRLMAAKEWLRPRRPPLLRGLDWSAVRAWNRILRVVRAIAHPPALRFRPARSLVVTYRQAYVSPGPGPVDTGLPSLSLVFRTQRRKVHLDFARKRNEFRPTNDDAALGFVGRFLPNGLARAGIRADR